MVRTLTIATAVLGATVLVGAQAQTPSTQKPYDAPSTQTPTPSRTQSSEAKVITYTGCLKTGASTGAFILSDVSPSSMGTTSSSVEPAAKGTAGMTKSYNLIAKSSPDLGKHLNHKISVTATGAPTRSTAAGSTPAPTSTTPGGATSPQPTETITVQSFKMVSATCP